MINDIFSFSNNNFPLPLGAMTQMSPGWQLQAYNGQLAAQQAYFEQIKEKLSKNSQAEKLQGIKQLCWKAKHNIAISPKIERKTYYGINNWCRSAKAGELL